MKELLDKKILNKFVDYLSTVLECQEVSDPSEVKKFDALRVKRHKELCEAVGIKYDGWGNHRDDVTIANFDQSELDEYFDGNIVKAAEFAYYKFIDHKNEESMMGYYTHYAWHGGIRRWYEDLKKMIEAEIAEFRKEVDERRDWWTENVGYTNEELEAYMKEHGCSYYTVCSEHDFNGHVSSIKRRLELYDKFTKNIQVRDLTQANIDAYMFTEEQYNKYAAKIALEFRRQEKKFKLAKELLEKYNERKN